MKKVGLLFVVVFTSFFFSSIYAQGFQEPSTGKAVIYFARITKYSSGATFEFFHNDEYIGAFKGKKYLRYECEPGEQLFWASSENREFLTANLEAGKTYIVVVDVIMGFWKGHVGFTPVHKDDTDLLEKVKDLVMSKPPVTISSEEIEKKNKKLKKFIAEELEHYQNVTKDKYDFHNISPDDYIPDNLLK